ncbi:MAG TPA: hypothetical protein VGH16_21760 [Candidatus Binatia bacterium]|jgi:outer membrane protein assembly factor BamE (lipoprotein component of BamABCDE complex)
MSIQTNKASVAVVFAFVVVSFLSTGCSVYMAANQPKAKDLSVLTPGTLRGNVIAELGSPIWSGDKNGDKADVFKFTQGYSTGAKAARAVFHGVSDFFTLGLWEVVSTPGEMIFSGTEMKLEVTYDKDDKVKTVTNLETGKSIEQTEAKPVAKVSEASSE